MGHEWVADGRADLGAIDATLADRGVRLVLGTVVDPAGVTRAKAVPRDRLPVFVDVGMGASPSWNVFCVDFGIAFTPALGVTGDLRLRIDPHVLHRRRRRRRLGARGPARAGRRRRTAGARGRGCGRSPHEPGRPA